MRKKKIRYWDKKLNIMWEPIELNKLINYLLFQSMPNSDGYKALKSHFKEMIPLDFTGLHDHNGKEIYEGDIVQDAFVVNNETYKSKPMEVFWDEEDCAFKIKPTIPYGSSSVSFSGKREIIGNVFEGVRDKAEGEKSP